MKALTSAQSSNGLKSNRLQLESLERRRLMSGTWTTIDSVPPADNVSNFPGAMAADSGGNIYAVGPSSNELRIREMAAGTGTFIELPAPSLPAPPAGATISTIGASATVDAQGDFFAGARIDYTDSSSTNVIFERPSGQSAFVAIPINLPNNAAWRPCDTLYGRFGGLAADSAGNIFCLDNILSAITTTTRHTTTTTYTKNAELFEMKAGQTSFNPIHQFPDGGNTSIAIINSGPSAGIYVAGGSGNQNTLGDWTVSKSTDGGSTWNTVDAFSENQYDPTGASAQNHTFATSIAGDAAGSGHVFVAGQASRFIITGYTYSKVKGQTVATPTGYSEIHWLTRESDDGGATWNTVDDLPPIDTRNGSNNIPYGIADLAGTVYVAGGQWTDANGYTDGVVRSNVGGTWHTEDDLVDAEYASVTVDPTTGTPYAGGGADMSAGGRMNTWIIRAGQAPATTTPSAESTASSTLIPTSNTRSSDSSTSWLKTQDDWKRPGRRNLRAWH